MFALITAPEGVEKGLAELGVSREELARVIAGDGRASAIERLDVYANMYFFRILEVLRGYFPRLLAALGDDAFHDLVTDYLLRHPSRHPSLRYVGRHLPAFVRAEGPGRARPWLAELAALEWARLDVFDRADDPLLSREALAALAPEAFAELPLALIGAHELVPARHAIELVWREAGADAAPASGPAAAPSDPPLAGDGPALLVWRRGAEVFHRRLPSAEQRALALVGAGGAGAGVSFGALCAALAADAGSDEEAAGQAAALLGRWLADELLRAPG
jgi:hypothetical protein